MASADVLQCLPALFGEPSEGAVVAMSNSVDSSYAAKLESQLVKQSDLIIDFTSLKTCLDPTSTCDNLQQQQPVSHGPRSMPLLIRGVLFNMHFFHVNN